MNTRKLQGRAPTLRDQQRTSFARPSNYGTVDFESLRDELKSRMFVGPQQPIQQRAEFQPDVVSDRANARHWQLVAEFQRYGYCELNQHGTPFVGDAFGYGQITEVTL